MSRRGRLHLPSVGWAVGIVALAAAALITAVAVKGNPEPRPRQQPPAAAAAEPACSHYVSPGGSDEDPGTAQRPWRTVTAALSSVAAGDTVCLSGGTYDEEVTARPPPGRAGARISLVGMEQGGERPEIRGGFALVDPDHWTITGLRFTNPVPANPDKRLVSILGGTGWVFENNEVVDGPYAGLLVGASESGGPPLDYTIRGNVIHDTGATNLYLNPSRASTGGLVERNLFFDADTENVKLGWGGDRGCRGRNFADFGIGEVTFRYNTLHGAERGALIIAEPGGLHDVDVYRNLFTGQPDHLVRYDSVEGCLGDRVHVYDNAGGFAPRFSEDFGDSPQNVAHELDNLFPIDPEYRTTDPDGFVPDNPPAQRYGRHGVGR